MFNDQLESVVGGEFSKLKHLRAYLDSLGWTGKSEQRVIVFSERIRTLEVIRDFLKAQYGVRTDENDKDKGKAVVRLFHAGLPDTEQMQIVEDFGKQDSPVRILLATDVASEGVNLHFFCNHLVHFDIPWSLITLEQRNGRIDRYGQKQTPHIVYLVTTAAAQNIKDDLTILIRLIEKEHTAHKNLGDAATILKMYDARQEEEYVEAGLSAGEKPEQILPDQPEDQGFLDLLLGSEAVPPAEDCRGQTPTLFADDLVFVKAAFDEIKAAEPDFPLPDFHPTLSSLTFTAPDDLWHRCQYLPRESLPKGREFLLTTDRNRVQRAIAEARKRSKEGESSWPKEQLLWELHPVMQWLLDKVICRFQRHDAPLVVAPKLGKGRGAYLFQGVLSNKRSQPVVVEWFAVHLRPGQSLAVGTFGELLAQTGFEQGLANTGQASKLIGVTGSKLAGAVEEARRYMELQGEIRLERLRERVAEDRGRFEAWHHRSLGQISKLQTHYQAVYGGTIPRNLQERLQSRRRNIDDRQQQRERWLTDTFTVVGTPYLKLAAVFVGE
jgi:hypothetical protein